MSKLIATPGELIGQCVVLFCDNTMVSTSDAWKEGPVWTSEQLEACRLICATSDPDCYREEKNCTGGKRWSECVDAMLAACGGAPGGPCRQLYLDSTCCEFSQCELKRKHFVECTRMTESAACLAAAERACTMPP